MTTDDRFGTTLSSWLREDAAHRVPGHLAETLVQTAATRQRPWWSSPERLLPMTTMTTGRVYARPPVFWFALIALLTLGIVGVGLLAGSLFATPAPVGLPSNGRILVADGTTLVSYAADGTGREELLRTTSGASTLSISPDGTKVAFVVSAPSPKVRVVTIADGTSVEIGVPAADVLGEEGVGWSPDGRTVVVAGRDGDRDDLYLVATDGSSVSTPIKGQLKPDAGVFQPAYSPDGTWISFASTDSRTSFTSLYVVHPDGSGLRDTQTESVSIGDSGGPLWAPAAGEHRIAYLTSHAGPLFTRILDLDTGSDVEIGGGFWPSWSPDGTHLATCCTTVTDVEAALAGGMSARTVFAEFPGNCGDDPATWTGRSVCSAAVWSPDGQWLIGADIAGKDLLVARSDGTGEPRRIALDAGNTLVGPRLPVAWQPVWP